MDTGLGLALCECCSLPLFLGVDCYHFHGDWTPPRGMDGFQLRHRFQKLSWAVISLDTEADPSLYALGPMHAPVWPLRDLVQHILIKTPVWLMHLTFLCRFRWNDCHSLDHGWSGPHCLGLCLLFLKRFDPRIKHLTLSLRRALLHLPNDGTDDGKDNEQHSYRYSGTGLGA